MNNFEKEIQNAIRELLTEHYYFLGLIKHINKLKKEISLAKKAF